MTLLWPSFSKSFISSEARDPFTGPKEESFKPDLGTKPLFVVILLNMPGIIGENSQECFRCLFSISFESYPASRRTLCNRAEKSSRETCFRGLVWFARPKFKALKIQAFRRSGSKSCSLYCKYKFDCFKYLDIIKYSRAQASFLKCPK